MLAQVVEYIFALLAITYSIHIEWTHCQSSYISYFHTCMRYTCILFQLLSLVLEATKTYGIPAPTRRWEASLCLFLRHVYIWMRVWVYRQTQIQKGTGGSLTLTNTRGLTGGCKLHNHHIGDSHTHLFSLHSETHIKYKLRTKSKNTKEKQKTWSFRCTLLTCRLQGSYERKKFTHHSIRHGTLRHLQHTCQRRITRGAVSD